MTLPQSSAPQYSALQLAWLQELGIEKPWLPHEQPAPKNINVQSAVAAVVPQPKRPVTAAPSRIVAPVIRPVLETQVDTPALAAAADDLASLAATERLSSKSCVNMVEASDSLGVSGLVKASDTFEVS
jgi:hypothetical protein